MGFSWKSEPWYLPNLFGSAQVLNQQETVAATNGSVHSTPGSFYLLQRAEDQVSSNHDVSDEMDRSAA
ncbi:hypothetical protein LUU34_00272100 [Aix galericulata]|nr:hypothetical protein LUU34_00272100 [Aix galericulata]